MPDKEENLTEVVSVWRNEQGHLSVRISPKIDPHLTLGVLRAFTQSLENDLSRSFVFEEKPKPNNEEQP